MARAPDRDSLGNAAGIPRAAIFAVPRAVQFDANVIDSGAAHQVSTGLEMFGKAPCRVARIGLEFLLRVLLALATVSATATADTDRRSILVLFSNQPALPANQLILEGLAAELRAGPADAEQIFYEYLDAVRFDRPEVQEAAAAYFRIKYGKRPPNIVLAVGPQALVFINERRSTLFPQAALAFAGVREERLPLGLPPHTPGILSEWNPVRSPELGLRLHRATRNIL